MSFLSKCQKCFFVEIDKLTLKFLWKRNGHRIAKTSWKKKKKMGEITLPYGKSYYIQAAVIKTLWYWRWVDNK